MEEKKEFKIPDHVINTYIKKYEQYPCITQTRNVIYSGVELLLKKKLKMKKFIGILYFPLQKIKIIWIFY